MEKLARAIFYFVQHGETEWNKKKIIQGHKNSALTLRGKATARNQARILSKQNINIIYTSDLGRCVQTAKIINKYLKVKLVKTKELRERNFGRLNGKPYEIIRKEIDLSDPDKTAPNGESLNQLKNRVINFILSLAKKNLGKVLLITHEGPARTILAAYYKVNYNVKQCDTRDDFVYKIEIMGGRIKRKRVLK